MAARIKGISIVLYEQLFSHKDEFNKDIYEQQPVTVDNVLVSPTSSEDAAEEMNLSGRKAVYTLAIPKGDTHDWENKKVEFFGQMFRTIGIPTEGIEELTPLDWNKKVKVERYE